jgi:hypothetical protein
LSLGGTEGDLYPVGYVGRTTPLLQRAARTPSGAEREASHERRKAQLGVGCFVKKGLRGELLLDSLVGPAYEHEDAIPLSFLEAHAPVPGRSNAQGQERIPHLWPGRLKGEDGLMLGAAFVTSKDLE